LNRSIAIGDIHGCLKTLVYLIEKEILLTKEDKLFLLGDYVNKGPDSKGVIDYLISLKKQNYQVECLRGNHDQLMLDAWKSDDKSENWILKGGDSTLRSFQCETISDIPSTYYSFLSATPFFVELENHFLIHAGFDFNANEIFEDTYSMLNIRDMNVDPSKIEGKKIIHGHVPVELEFLLGKMKSEWNEISIDTGCVYVDQPGKGYLTAMILDTYELFYVKNKDL